MNIAEVRRLRVSTLFVLAGLMVCTPAIAQRGKSEYKKGDQVEVKDDFEWKQGTVVGETGLGRVEVRVEDRDIPRNLPKFAREQMLTRSYDPDDVRPVAGAAGVNDDAPSRKWTDRSGKFSIEARYDGMNGTSVVLLKSDGKKVNVPVEKLSEADKKYLQELTNPTENPFGEAANTEGTVATGPMKKAIWREAKQVRPEKFSKWTFTPTGGSGSEMLRLAGAADAEVALSEIPDSDPFFEDVEGIFVSRDGNRVVVCRNRGDVSQDKENHLEVVDIAKQKVGGLVPLPPATAMLDVDAGANLVMYRTDEFHSGTKGVLTIARIEGSKLAPVAQWEPYDHEDFRPARDVENAWFLSGDRVLTINNHGKALTVWDVASCKALTNVPVGSSINLKTALSPDRTLLAIVMKDSIAIIDVVGGKHVATIAGEGRSFTDVGFRSDNARLAGLSDEGVAVWDLTSGKELSAFYNAAMGRQTGLTWAGKYLLAQSRYLFDVERRILLWEYQDGPGMGRTSAFRDGKLYIVPKPMRESETMLISAALPHQGAIAEAKSLPSAAELLVVKPGDSVAVEVDIDPGIVLTEDVRKSLTAKIQEAGLENEEGSNVVVLNPGDAQEDLIRQALAAALQEAGLRVVKSSNLVVKAVCKPQPQQTVRINVDGRFPPRPEDIQERSITPHASYLEMSLNGETLWKRGFVAQPGVTIWLNQGETLDQALQRLTQPNTSLFTNAKFNPYVARPGKASPYGAYGVSQFTTRGLVDGQSASGGGAAFE